MVLIAYCSEIYEWPAERVIVIIHEKPDENVSGVRILLTDKS